MGGSGSGNHYHWWRPSKKATVEDCLSIDANRWMRDGVLRAGVHRTGSYEWTYPGGRKCSIGYEVQTRNPGCSTVRLFYTWTRADTEQREHLSYHVTLATTRPHFGGIRWWFNCPLAVGGRWCGRRVGKLYLPSGGRYFGCRHCYDLTYTSCQESRKYGVLYRLMAEGTGFDPATVRRVMSRIGKRR